MATAYPRRDDAVQYEQFDGTLESVQRISNLTHKHLYVKVEPLFPFLPGDTVRLRSFSTADNPDEQVRVGDYVVKAPGGVTSRCSESVFNAKYSKDGN